MGDWKFSVGNLARRSPHAPVAVSPASADTDRPFTRFANGYPDQEAGFAWRSDGLYAADFDLNLLETESSRADAPTGWADLLNALAGSPGLPANPPDWGTYAGKTALRIYRPVVQEIEVMPEESVTLALSLYLPVLSSATGVRVRVIDSWSGLGWNGAAWVANGILTTQSSDDTWADSTNVITPNASRTERSTYSVVITPVAAAYDATTYAYAQAALYAEANLAALIGHNLPGSAVVTLGALTLTPVQPSLFTLGAAVHTRVWRLSIDLSADAHAPRPIIGEVWIGKSRTCARSPIGPLSWGESDPDQVRVESGARIEVVTLGKRAAQKHRLSFIAETEAGYIQARDHLTRLTRFGFDPILLLPDAFEENRVMHGRLGKEVGYSRIETTPQYVTSYELEFQESPFAK